MGIRARAAPSLVGRGVMSPAAVGTVLSMTPLIGQLTAAVLMLAGVVAAWSASLDIARLVVQAARGRHRIRRFDRRGE